MVCKIFGLLKNTLRFIAGAIYLATNVISGQDIALKLESTNAEKPQLRHEFSIYKRLTGGVGIPSVGWFGRESKHNAMVLQLLDLSLEDLFNSCNRIFSLKTTILLAEKLVCICILLLSV